MSHTQDSQNSRTVQKAPFCLGWLTLPLGQKRWLFLGLVLFATLGAVFIAKYGRRAWNSLERRWYGPATLIKEQIQDDGTYHNLIFLHHSVGENLIIHGKVRERFTQKGYQLWDHAYNRDGLTRPDGNQSHTHYGIPEVTSEITNGGNTDPEGLAVLFAQPPHTPPDNAFSRLLQHRVIIFKSCFPNNALKSDEMLERNKTLYLGMRQSMDQHPDHVFILMTTPPLHPQETNQDEANRARQLSQWLRSDAFDMGHPNLFVFDFYNLLADPATNMLRTEYQPKRGRADSHPNALANETIGPQFVDFVDQAIQTYKSNPHPTS